MRVCQQNRQQTRWTQRHRTGRSQALTPENSRLHGTHWTHWLGEEQPPDQAIRQVFTAAEASAAPLFAPVTADTRRQSAT